MRQATIGDDGRIYDADGNPADGQKKTVQRKSHGQMLRNKPRQRGGFYRSLGQASVAVAPAVPAPTPGVAYRQAARVAVPLSQGYTFTRSEGDPKTQVYPGMFVVSDRYPNNLFRVAFRPPTNNNEAFTRLAILDGTGAGDYIEVLVQPDGSTNPSLMGDFKVVPIENYVIVEYSIQQYPTPQIPGGAWKADFYWIYFAIDQASYQMATLNEASTPVALGNAWADLFSQTASALSFIVDAVDSLGWSFDFGKIGQKELKILTKISSDIFSKIVVMYDLLNPTSQNTVFKTADGDKVEAFQQKADEMVIMRPYWVTMLARSSLYNQQTNIINAWMAKQMFEKGLDWSADAVTLTTNLKGDVISAITDPSITEGAISAADAQTQMDALQAEYQTSYAGIKANSDTFDSQWAASDLKDYSPNGLYTFSGIYNMMLKENADLCMEIRENIKDLLSGADLDNPEGLGQAAAFIPPGDYASVIAMVGPGLDLRKKTSDIAKSDFLSMQKELEKGMSRDAAVNRGREQIINIRQQVEALRAKYADVSSAVPVRTVERPASELNRSVMKLVSPEDTEARTEGRKAVRAIPSTPEGSIRQGLDQMVDKLVDAERLLRGTIYEEDGVTPKDIAKLTTDDLNKVSVMRDQAAKLLGEAFTQSFVEVTKDEKSGQEVIVNILAPGLIDAGGNVKEKVAFDILSTVVDSAISAEIFSPNAVAGIGRIVAGDVDLDANTLSEKYHSLADDLRNKIDDLKYDKTVTDPRTGQPVPRSMPADPTIRARLQKQLDYTERLAGIFSSAETAEALVFEYQGKILSYQDVIDASPNRTVPATFEMLTDAKSIIDLGTSEIQLATMLNGQISGASAIPEYQAVLKTDANSKLAGALANAISDLNAKIGKLNEYRSAKGQQMMNAGQLGMQEVNDAMKAVVDATEKLRNAQNAVLEAIKQINAQRVGIRVKNLFQKLYSMTAPVEVIEFGKKGSFGSVIALVLIGPLRLGIVWAIAHLVLNFLPAGIRENNPVTWVETIIGGLTGLIFSRRVGDVVPNKGEEKPSSFGSSFFWTALGISMIFFGKQLFPVVGDIVRTVGAGLKTVNQLIPWAKKKGKRGRPSEGGDSGERKLKGRGAPIEVDQAVIDLDEARARGDARDEEKIIKKLKRAAERGQTVPPGLWGYYRRR
jgi:hypothetical protein